MGAARGAALRRRRPRRDPRPDRRARSDAPMRRPRWRSSWGRGRRRRSRELLSEAGFGAIETRRDLAGHRAGSAGGAMSGPAQPRSSSSRAAAPRPPARRWRRCIAAGGVAVFPADGLYGLACDPLDSGGDRAHPPPQGARRRQVLGGHVLLAAGDAGAGRRPRPAHRGRGQRPAAGPGDAGRRQPRPPLPARLPRGPRAARRPPARRPAGRGDVPDLPDLGQPQRRAGAGALRGRPRRRSSPAPTWRSTAAS